jgi:hypothetical protein
MRHLIKPLASKALPKPPAFYAAHNTDILCHFFSVGLVEEVLSVNFRIENHTLARSGGYPVVSGTVYKLQRKQGKQYVMHQWYHQLLTRSIHKLVVEYGEQRQVFAFNFL